MSDLNELNDLKQKTFMNDLAYKIEMAKKTQRLETEKKQYEIFKKSADEMLNDISALKAYKIVDKLIDNKEDILGSIKDYDKEWKDWYNKQEAIENVKLENLKTENNQLLENLQTLKNKIDDPVKQKELAEIENQLKTITQTQVDLVSDTGNALAQLKQNITLSTATQAQKLQEEFQKKTQDEQPTKQEESTKVESIAQEPMTQELMAVEPMKQESKTQEPIKQESMVQESMTQESKTQDPIKQESIAVEQIKQESIAVESNEEKEKELAAQKAKEEEEKKKKCIESGKYVLSFKTKVEDVVKIINEIENMLKDRYKLNLTEEEIGKFKTKANDLKDNLVNINNNIQKLFEEDKLIIVFLNNINESIKAGVAENVKLEVNDILCDTINNIQKKIDSEYKKNYQQLETEIDNLLKDIKKYFEDCNKSFIDDVNTIIANLAQIKNDIKKLIEAVDIKGKLIEPIELPKPDDTTCFNYVTRTKELTELKKELMSQKQSIDNLLENIQKLKNDVKELDVLKNSIKTIPGGIGKILEDDIGKLKEKFELDNKEIMDSDLKINERLQKVMYWISKFQEKGGEDDPDEITEFNQGVQKTKNLVDNIEKKIKSTNTISKELRDIFQEVQEYIENTINLTQTVIEKNIESLKNPLLKESLSKVGEKLKELFNSDKLTQLVNLNEDISGALRVYIKIKPELSDIPKEKDNKESNDPKDSNDHKEYLIKRASIQKEEKQKYVVEGKEGSFKITVKDPCLQNDFKSQKRTYGDFYSVYNSYDFQTNEKVFEGGKTDGPNGVAFIDVPGLGSVTQQIKDGYSVILFGYGYSGSGKTATLLGFESNGNKKMGIVQLTLEKLKKENDKISIKLTDVFELYYNYTDPKNIKIKQKYNLSKSSNAVEMSGKFYVWNITGKETIRDLTIQTDLKTKFVKKFITDTNETTVIKKLIEEYVEIVEPASKEIIEIGNLKTNIEKGNVSDLINLTTQLEKLRKYGSTGRNFNLPKTVKATPNNNNSSRSHLFLTFEITIPGKTPGYLTVIDMAGRESPIDILTNVLRDASKPDASKPDASKNSLAKYTSPFTYLKSLNSLETQPTVLLDLPGTDDKFDLYNVVKEGFFINETINHMMWYFKSKVSNSNYEPTLMTTTDEQGKIINPIVQSTDNNKYYVPANVFVNPKNEFNIFQNSENLKTHITNEQNTIFITSVLDKLKNLGGNNESKPSKFIVVCGLRKDEKCIDSAESTLDFASRVTSAGTFNPNIK